MRTYWLFLVIAPALLVAQPSAPDSPRLWSGTVVNLSAPGDVMRPKVGVDEEGRAIAVWLEHYPPNQGRIMATRRTASGWSPARVVADPGIAGPPELTVDPRGFATAAWEVYAPNVGPVHVSRYSPASDTWSLAATLTPAGWSPRIAADGAGNVLAVWLDASGVTAWSRYSSTTGAWAFPAALIRPGTTPALSVNSAGDGVALWGGSSGLAGKYYLAAANAWFDLPVVPASSAPFQVVSAVDPFGNIAVVWVESSGGPPPFKVMGAWFERATQRWRAQEELAVSAAPVFGVSVVVDAAATATAAWQVDVDAGPSRVEAVRYAARTGVFSETVVLGTGVEPALTLDGEGNVVAAWAEATSANRVVIVSARFDVLAGIWTAPVPLSDPAVRATEPRLAADSLGNVTAVWTARPTTASWTIQSTAWMGQLGPPRITGVTPSANALTVAFAPPSSVDVAYRPSNYEFSIDGGATWTARDPASTASPVVIAGLVDGVAYPVRIRAVNAVGAGRPSATLDAIPGIGCPGPCALVATEVRDGQVTLEWVPPDVGLVPTGYLVESGLNPGEVAASIPTGSAATRFTIAAPSGRFFVRVVAVAGAIRSGPSPEIRLAVNVAARPSPPTDLRGLVNGSNVTLAWRNTFDDGPPSSLWLSVSRQAWGAAPPVPVVETYSYVNVPPGSYRVTVSAANAYGVSPPSNAVTLVVPGPCPGVPDAPVNVHAFAQGTTILLSWWAPPGGVPASGYVVSVSGAWTGRFTTTERALSGWAAPGTYAIQVAAANPCGVGPSATAVTVVVP